MSISAADLRDVRIATSRKGYDTTEVHAFLDRCVAALEAHESGGDGAAVLRAAEVHEVTFQMGRKAADPDQVDDLLEQVQAALAAHEQQAPATPAAAPAAPAPAPKPAAEVEESGTVLVTLADGSVERLPGAAAYTVAAGGRLVVHRAGGGSASIPAGRWTDVAFDRDA